MITLKYNDYPKTPKLITSSSTFKRGGLSYHLFDENYSEVNDGKVFECGIYEFDLIFTLIYERSTPTLYDHAYANLETLKLRFEVKDNEVLVYLPYYKGNLKKDSNWADEWEINSWDSNRAAIDRAYEEDVIWPDDFISEKLMTYYKQAKIDLSFNFISKYLEKNLNFEKDSVPIKTKVVAIK